MTKIWYIVARLIQVISVIGNLFAVCIIALDLAGQLETEGVWLTSIFLFIVCYLLGLLYRKIDDCLRHTPYIEVVYSYF